MNEKEKTFVSAVIYIHNSEKHIREYLETIIRTIEDNFEHSEIICVNDCSVDRSTEIIKEISEAEASTTVSIINMSYFHGLEVAMNAGIDIAIGDFVFEFDNTYLDFDETVIMDVYHRSVQGYDIVSAVPNRKERFTSRMFYSVFDRYSERTYRMHTESFRILSRRVINRIHSMHIIVPYRKAVYAESGLKTDQIVYQVKKMQNIPIDKTERRYKSRLAVDSLILFTVVGYRFTIAMTIIMMLISVLMIVYSVAVYVTSTPVEGWTTTILFLSVAFFGLFGILTIIIKYLQMLVNMTYRRKHYSYENIEKLTK